MKGVWMRYNMKPVVRGVAERDKLVLDNLGLVTFTLYKLKEVTRFAAVLGHQDAIQIGYLVLVRAADLWRPEIGEFSTYAVACIRTSLFQRYKRRIEEVPVLLASQMEPSIDLNYVYYPEEERLYDLTPDASEIIDVVLKTLKPREREIIRMRFGLGDKCMSLQEVAVVFKLTRERVRQIEFGALAKLRRTARAHYLWERLGLNVPEPKEEELLSEGVSPIPFRHKASAYVNE
jgi:RNA polymerase sigma factor (sigma-70 family)